jgi:hypothetical protein
MNFITALTYGFADPHWVKKMAIGVLMVFLGAFPVIGLLSIFLFLFGWMYETATRVKNNEQFPLAGWGNMNGKALKGLQVLLGLVVYSLPAVIFSLLAVPPAEAAGPGAGQASTALGSAIKLSVNEWYTISAILFLAGVVNWLSGFVRFLDRPKLSTFLQFGQNLTLMRHHPLDFGMAFLCLLGGNIVGSVVTILSFGFLTFFFMSYFVSHIIGQLARKIAGDAIPAAPQPT